ncbi:MAG: hypothetical protein QOI71_3540 [Gaiellales bacterium]|nr:hypothetical protein [Gaiellales bacterium]
MHAAPRPDSPEKARDGVPVRLAASAEGDVAPERHHLNSEELASCPAGSPACESTKDPPRSSFRLPSAKRQCRSQIGHRQWPVMRRESPPRGGRRCGGRLASSRRQRPAWHDRESVPARAPEHVGRRAGESRPDRRDAHGQAAERSRRSRRSSSASCTAFVAAPLRRLSATTQSASVFGSPRSRRMRPTRTSSRPSASIAIG